MTEQGVGVVRPLPGDGVVAHLNGLLLVCALENRAPESPAAVDQPVADLLAALRETAATGGDGRALARRVAQVLARAMDRSIAGEPVSCAVAGPAGGGVAVLVSGSATATVSGGPDGDVRLAGREALTWTDRLVAGPVAKIELRLPGAGQPAPYARLDGGVVTGAGVELDLTRAGEPVLPPPFVRPAPPPMPPHQPPGYFGAPPGPAQPFPPFEPPEPLPAREPVVPPPLPPLPPAGPPPEPVPGPPPHGFGLPAPLGSGPHGAGQHGAGQHGAGQHGGNASNGPGPVLPPPHHADLPLSAPPAPSGPPPHAPHPLDPVSPGSALPPLPPLPGPGAPFGEHGTPPPFGEHGTPPPFGEHGTPPPFG
ncbi:hypothetical protein, partial [Planotetraspora thailandica]